MPESCSAGELEHRPEELCWCACLMQASPGILPVYCFSTSGVYHTHMYTPTHAEPERVGGGGGQCKCVSIHYVRVCACVRKPGEKKETVHCGVSLISASVHEHVSRSHGLLVKSHKYAAPIP